MKKKLFWMASLCVALGSVMALAGCAAMDFNFRNLNKDKGENKVFEIKETFDKISINVDTTDVKFTLASEGTAPTITYTEHKKMPYTISVENQTLSISITDERKWYDHIGIFFDDLTMEICLPSSAYASLTLESDTSDVYMPNGFTFTNASLETDTGDIVWSANVTQSLVLSTDTGDVDVKNCTLGSAQITTSTGDVDVENLNVSGALQITRTTGDAELNSVQCAELSVISSTGDVEMRSVVATQKMYVETSTGDVEFNDIDAPSMQFKTNTGDVEGRLQSGKIFTYATDTGDVRLPANGDNGTCHIQTDTGDIKITVR